MRSWRSSTECIDAVLLPWSYAYRRGLSVKDALHDLAQARDDGARWVVRADIKDCFEAIPRWSVAERLRSTITDERAVHVVTQFVNRYGATLLSSAPEKAGASTRGARSLPS